MSLFPLSDTVTNSIEKLWRDFLGVGIGKGFKFHLVNWPKVCTPIFEGGLRV